MARKPTLTIFYQFNPWQSTIGGIQTLIRYYIKYAPPTFNVRLVGTSVDAKQALGRWYEIELEGRSLQFMPLFRVQDDNVRKLVPTSVRYTLALWGKNLSSDFMHFHRLEPTLMTRRWAGDKILFIHNDIHQQINSSGGSKNAILWRRFPQVYFALEKRVLGQFKTVLSCNSDAVEFYRRQYPRWADRIQLVRNIVDHELFYAGSPLEREQKRHEFALQMGLPPETRFLLFAGRLHPQKDPLLLLQAFAALKEPHMHLLVAGEGELMQAIKTEINTLGLQGKVSLLGSVALPQLAELHRLSSAVVLTSAYEGLPLVVLEALASGTPVVTTNCGETPKFLQPGSGLVCKERTPNAIAQALQTLLSHPEHFSTQACQDTARPFYAQVVVEEMYERMYSRWQESTLSRNVSTP